MNRARRRLASLALFATALSPAIAKADEHSIIRSPGDHPPYIFEAEPHLLVGYSGPFDDGGDFGVGFRGTVHIANGFVPSINDSVGVGFGIDIGTNGHVLIPIVMQWNFWLFHALVGLRRARVRHRIGRPDCPLAGVLRGRPLHFTDRIALTMRVGYPDFSLGVSFFL